MSYLLKHNAVRKTYGIQSHIRKYDKKNPPRVNEGDKIFKLLKLLA